MSKALSFAKLDFMTIKSYLTVRVLIIFAALTFGLSFMTNSILVSCGMALMLASVFTAYPFAIGEKSNMDALYITIGADSETVVTGRYIFAFIMFILSIAVEVIIGGAGVFIYSLTGGELSTVGVAEMIGFIAVLMFILELIMLPVYFKMPYQKAKFASLISIGAIGGIGGAFSGFTDDSAYESVENLASEHLLSSFMIPLIILIILAIAVIISYSFSLHFYKKREF